MNPSPSGRRPDVILVCGPTAVGKTAVGIALARALGTEIVNADSMQVYRYMDIGTAKPTPAERAAVKHHLIDVVDPDAPFDAARFAHLGRQVVADLHRRGRPAVVVGGTGLYIKALVKGLFAAAPADPGVRRRLREEASVHGPSALHARLERADPQTAARLHPNDAFRIVRALEVLELTGRPISELHREHGFGDAPFRTLTIGLAMDRPDLYGRIDRRVDAMLAAGLEAEVRALLARGYGADLKPMQAIGYSHMLAHLAGRISREECARTLKRDTRRFAKRQLTWLRAQPEVDWLPPEPPRDVIRLAEDFLSRARAG
jgi:tRNA dimethylallyltransferase